MVGGDCSHHFQLYIGQRIVLRWTETPISASEQLGQDKAQLKDVRLGSNWRLLTRVGYEIGRPVKVGHANSNGLLEQVSVFFAYIVQPLKQSKVAQNAGVAFNKNVLRLYISMDYGRLLRIKVCERCQQLSCIYRLFGD